MSKDKPEREYRVFAAYDSETSNIIRPFERPFAFPVTHQIGILDESINYRDITNDNVRDLVEVEIYRHAVDAFELFDDILAFDLGFCPIVMVHNLSFDMWGISPFFASHDCKVLAKSATKPISIKIMNDDGVPGLMFWDTQGFFGKSLKTMGAECGFPKLAGDWDYSLVRTPDTPLTSEEVAYAEHDIFALFAYLGFYCRNNPDVDSALLGTRVSTKTGAVRAKKTAAFNWAKGRGRRRNTGQYWHALNQQERPKSDDELRFMHACTRGGFVFCSQNNANVPFSLEGTDRAVLGFDADSQHPAQMTSHYYPVHFTRETPQLLQLSADLVRRVSVDELVDNWHKPFPVAFNALFHFSNLRLKKNSIFERDGISPLASSRFSREPVEYADQADSAVAFNLEQMARGFRDHATDASFSFGKLNSCREATLFLTELEFWLVNQCFDYDSCQPLDGFGTDRFVRPSDMAILSVMKFYRDKKHFKKAKGAFEQAKHIDLDSLKEFVPESLAQAMDEGTADSLEVDAFYQFVKSNLNALFGIEATNEAKPDYTISEQGIVLEEPKGIDDLPRNSKAWYQFGQRIVGWSRIAQVVHLLKVAPLVDTFINGDTDSIKALAPLENREAIEHVFAEIGEKIKAARLHVCKRIEESMPDEYVDLGTMGQYELEFETRNFCAGWNKSYLYMEPSPRTGLQEFHITMAGIPSENRINLPGGGELDHSLKAICEHMYHEWGWSFERICNLILGFNLTIDSLITGLNSRFAPDWGEWFDGDITDYRGMTAHVHEPYALALASESKTTNSTLAPENHTNMRFSLANNPAVNIKSHILCWDIGEEPRILEV